MNNDEIFDNYKNYNRQIKIEDRFDTILELNLMEMFFFHIIKDKLHLSNSKTIIILNSSTIDSQNNFSLILDDSILFCYQIFNKPTNSH